MNCNITATRKATVERENVTIPSGVASGGALGARAPPLCLPTEWAGLGYQQ